MLPSGLALVALVDHSAVVLQQVATWEGESQGPDDGRIEPVDRVLREVRQPLPLQPIDVLPWVVLRRRLAGLGLEPLGQVLGRRGEPGDERCL